MNTYLLDGLFTCPHCDALYTKLRNEPPDPSKTVITCVACSRAMYDQRWGGSAKFSLVEQPQRKTQ